MRQVITIDFLDYGKVKIETPNDTMLSVSEIYRISDDLSSTMATDYIDIDIKETENFENK